MGSILSSVLGGDTVGGVGSLLSESALGAGIGGFLQGMLNKEKAA
jgi:hypothetical protein